MKHARLDLARSAELLPSLEGGLAVFGQIEIDRLRGLDFSTLSAVSDGFVTTEVLKRAGIRVARSVSEDAAHAIVFLPRAKSEAWRLISLAIRFAETGWIVIDGQKTDGIESVAKQIARSVSNVGSYSKGHGKCIWFRAEDAQHLVQDVVENEANKDGFVTAPGVFSADSIDPASAFLIETLPADLSGDLADLGAGWGFLSASILATHPKIKALHLVEDNAAALDCARANVDDPRAAFHWADALTWRAPKSLDAIIMNPPFHTGRAAEPTLGIAFIQAAARALRPGGQLFMVANAHLPYETALEQSFETSSVLARTNRFKVFCAKRGRTKSV